MSRRAARRLSSSLGRDPKSAVRRPGGPAWAFGRAVRFEEAEEGGPGPGEGYALPSTLTPRGTVFGGGGERFAAGHGSARNVPGPGDRPVGMGLGKVK